jgi:hypothetical protein
MTRTTAAATTEALLGAVLAGTAGHWFITPIRHPHAAPWQVIAVAAQFVAGLGLLGYAMLMERRERADDREFERRDRTG